MGGGLTRKQMLHALFEKLQTAGMCTVHISFFFICVCVCVNLIIFKDTSPKRVGGQKIKESKLVCTRQATVRPPPHPLLGFQRSYVTTIHVTTKSDTQICRDLKTCSDRLVRAPTHATRAFAGSPFALRKWGTGNGGGLEAMAPSCGATRRRAH